jgi:hypothetical protein
MEEILDNKDTRSMFSGEKPLPNSNAILVLGIISLVTWCLYAIPGIVCAIIALVLFAKNKKIYQEDPMSYNTSYKNAKAGQVCAIIGLCLSALFLIYIIFLVVALGSIFSSMGRF